MIDDPNKTATLKEILNSESCGGWILKDKIIPIYNEGCHAEFAFEILKTILSISENHQEKLKKFETRKQFTRYYSMYRVMYRLGFIRLSVVDLEKTYLVMELSKYCKPNDYQINILNKADYKDKIEIYYNRQGNHGYHG